jgi:hypothetical protein
MRALGEVFMTKFLVILWQLLWGIAALGELKYGEMHMFWFQLIMFLAIPGIWLGSIIYSRTPAGEARAERLRREKFYEAHQRASRSKNEPSHTSPHGQPSSQMRPAGTGRAVKPGKLMHPSPESFEVYCRDWCEYLGYEGAVKTQNTRDGGIDIKSTNMIAQVKFQVSPVGVKPVRELNGVRKPGEEVLFFALNGFTPEARRAAAEMNITLIRVSPLEGQIDILS